MNSRHSFALSAVAALLLAGCVSGESSSEPLVDPSGFERGFGAVSGLVTDDELVPLENVTITLVELQETTLTGPGGSFAFERVVEGAYTLAAEHLHYESATVPLVVLPDEAAHVDVRLVKLPEFRPINLTVKFPGHYDCAAEYLIITGDCGILYENVTCTINYCQSDPVFQEKYQFPADVKPRWETIIAELTWTVNPSNGIDGMRMYLENTNASAQGGHSKKVNRVDANTQPLVLRVDRGTTYPGGDVYEGTKTKAFIPDEGRLEQIRVFPKGHAWSTTRTVCDSGGRCLLGVGGALSVDFTVWLTVFYNEAAPASFSAIPK